MWNRALHPTNRSPGIAASQRKSAEQSRWATRLISRPEYFPQRVIANPVILQAELELRLQNTMLCRSHFPIMNADLLGKRACLPSAHACADDGNMVYRAALDRYVTSDCFEALAAEDLACSGHMLDADKTVIVDSSG